jgi:hypothetical protein
MTPFHAFIQSFNVLQYFAHSAVGAPKRTADQVIQEVKPLAEESLQFMEAECDAFFKGIGYVSIIHLPDGRFVYKRIDPSKVSIKI